MKKLLWKRSLLSILALAACSAAALAMMRADFTWTGGGGPAHTSFSFPCNWVHFICNENGPYPDDTGDDATFPWKTTGAWDCGLITEEIGDLTIEGNVDFNVLDDPGLPFTLTVTRLKIEPTQGDIEITMADGGIIKVEE